MITSSSARISTLVTAPDGALVTLDAAKLFLRVDHTADDELITALCATAASHLDAEHGILGRALLTQTWRLAINHAPRGRAVDLPVPPVTAIDAVSYTDADGIDRTMPGADYRLVADGDRAALELAEGASWPGVAHRSAAFRVDYVTGYGGAADVPPELMTAAKLLVAHCYDNRAVTTDGQAAELPLGVRALTQPFRVLRGLA